jgi:hypothetical protein
MVVPLAALFYMVGREGEKCIRWCKSVMHLFTPINTSVTVRTSLFRTAPHNFHLTASHNLERVTGYWVS